jgi:hypothetical protein
MICKVARVSEDYVMKMYGGVEAKLHAFLTSEMDGGEWSGSQCVAL